MMRQAMLSQQAEEIADLNRAILMSLQENDAMALTAGMRCVHSCKLMCIYLLIERGKECSHKNFCFYNIYAEEEIEMMLILCLLLNDILFYSSFISGSVEPSDAASGAGASAGGGAPVAPSEENIDLLLSMGFEREKVVTALVVTRNNVERAAEKLLMGD